MNTIKNIFTSFKDFLRSTSLTTRVFAFLTILALGAGLVMYSARESNTVFFADYALYTALAEENDNAAFTPGSPNNPVRIELNQVLTQVLATHMVATDRLARATHGLELVVQAEKQIDAITETGAKVDTAVAKMQIDALAHVASGDTTFQIIALAKKRASIVSDIRAYSYKADFEIGNIFKRIITDRGVLADAYVLDLNSEIPAVEAQFDQRSALYSELQNTTTAIQSAYTSMGGVYTGPSKSTGSTH